MMVPLKPPSRFNSHKGFLVSLLALTMSFGAGISMVAPVMAAPVVDDLPQAGHLLDQPQTQPAPPAPAVPPVANAGDLLEPGPAPQGPVTDTLPAAGHLADDSAQPSDAAVAPLQLEVLINGYKVGLVVGFGKKPDGNLASARAELEAIGIKVPGKGADTQQIALNTIPSLNYTTDELAQTIDIKLSDQFRVPKNINLTPAQDMVSAQSDYGLVLNYSGYAAANAKLALNTPSFTGASINLDGRAFSNYGVFQQTADVGTTTFADFAATRLNTTWIYSNQKRAETYRLGDIVSGGLNWTRPVRLGGAQAQRNFTLRPDLITSPLTSLQGTAAVPSTLDVYLNGLKSYSQDIPEGPFEVSRLPVISSQGTARVVVTDPSGRQTSSEKPLYNAAMLLSPGFYDYAVDVGLARRSYGTRSFDYGSEPLAMASARYGISSILTGEAHIEAKADMIEGGLGGVFLAGPFGTFSTAVAASAYQKNTGGYGYLGWDWQYDNFLVHASSARIFGSFTDLAAATALTDSTGLSTSAVSKAVDQITLSYGIPNFDADIGLNLSHVKAANGSETTPLGLNFTKSFAHDISAYVSAYVDLTNRGDYGATIGFSMPFGKNHDMNVAADTTYDNTGTSAEASAFKQMDNSYGSYGWRVAARENQTHDLLAAGSYRARQVVVAGSLQSQNDRVTGKAIVEGSVVATKSGVFLGNPVADSFAVVDAGVKDIPVNYENRYVGKTGSSGKMLLTQVRSYRPTRVSIDATTLPLNSDVTETEKTIAPREMGGVTVSFGVKAQSSAAIVIIKDKGGQFLEAGTEIRMAGQKEPFIMGYDGQVYVTDITAANTLSAAAKSGDCTVSFDYKIDAKAQTVIGPLTCR